MMSKKPFAKKIASERPDHIYLVNGNSGKQEYWCIVKIDQLKLDAFKRKLGGNIRVQDFGTVLQWGYGSAPRDDRLAQL